LAFGGECIMTSEDLARALSVGRSHSYVAEIRGLLEAPGYVRTTALYEGNRVCVAFERWGMDEGGLYFWASFPSLEAMVTCIESFLGSPITSWPLLAEYPERPPATDEAATARSFIDLLKLGRLPLPSCGGFEARGSSYWLQFLGRTSAERGDAADPPAARRAADLGR
jgi:hypothetical protein